MSSAFPIYHPEDNDLWVLERIIEWAIDLWPDSGKPGVLSVLAMQRSLKLNLVSW